MLIIFNWNGEKCALRNSNLWIQWITRNVVSNFFIVESFSSSLIPSLKIALYSMWGKNGKISLHFLRNWQSKQMFCQDEESGWRPQLLKIYKVANAPINCKLLYTLEEELYSFLFITLFCHFIAVFRFTLNDSFEVGQRNSLKGLENSCKSPNQARWTILSYLFPLVFA